MSILDAMPKQSWDTVVMFEASKPQQPGIQVRPEDNLMVEEDQGLILSDDKTFTIHSPHLTASKWWIGSLGRTVRVQRNISFHDLT